MRIVVTGAEGFIGRNLRVRLREHNHDVRGVTRTTAPDQLLAELSEADFVFHLAGVNRPRDESEFVTGNVRFTETVCSGLAKSGRRVPVAYASSAHAMLGTAYGLSKRAAEDVLLAYGRDSGTSVYVFRLPNVFGKWCRPQYNSVVATFCHQIAHGLPIQINDPASSLRLLHVDDLVDALIRLLEPHARASGYVDAGPVYETTVGDLARILEGFVESRKSLLTLRVGAGLLRALYSTYISYLPTASFAYEVPRHADSRGVFVEMLKTPDCGQFSYFTAQPGVTRGEHYHHTKTEKFLVVRGTAKFCFRNIDTGETYELTTCGGEARVVETVPGWAHNIVNIGDDELVVMLWANEIFDRARPDTVAMKVSP